MTRGCEWRHAPEAHAEDFGDFEKSQLVELLARKRTVNFRGRTCWVAGGKGSIERLCLSPYVEKPFNSKVIKKSFVPELRSRKCFLCFGIPMLYIWVMNIICTFHIFMYGYATLSPCLTGITVTSWVPP